MGDELTDKLHAIESKARATPSDAEVRIAQAVLLMELYKRDGNPDHLDRAKEVTRFIYEGIKEGEDNNKTESKEDCLEGYVFCHDRRKDYGDQPIWGIKRFGSEDHIHKAEAITNFLKDDPILNIPSTPAPLIYDDGLCLLITQTIPGLDGYVLLEKLGAASKEHENEVKTFVDNFSNILLFLTEYFHNVFSLPGDVMSQEEYINEGIEKIVSTVREVKDQMREELWKKALTSDDDLQRDYLVDEFKYVNKAVQAIAGRFVNTGMTVISRDASPKNFIFYVSKPDPSFEDIVASLKQRGMFNSVFNIDFYATKCSHKFEDMFAIVDDYCFSDFDMTSSRELISVLHEKTAHYIISRTAGKILMKIVDDYLEKNNSDSLNFASCRLQNMPHVVQTMNSPEDLFVASVHYKNALALFKTYDINKNQAHLHQGMEEMNGAEIVCQTILQKSVNQHKLKTAKHYLKQINNIKAKYQQITR